MKRILLMIVFSILCGTVFASQQEDVVNFFKKLIAEKNACSDYKAFKAVSLKYGTQDMIKEFRKNEEQIEKMPQGFKDDLFNMMKSNEFAPGNLDVKDVRVQGENATIIFGVKGRPQLNGTGTFVKENGDWKVKEISEKGNLPAREALTGSSVSK